jgi:hypothetical protein
VFHEVAFRILERSPPASTIAAEEVFRWLIRTEQLPRQFDPRSSFGNFALTVAAREGFHIDLLVWTDSTTAIHQHGFSGAFHVLQGSSLHTLWSFDEDRRWSERLRQGRLSVRSTEWLGVGSTRPILPGASMIHSLFHLEQPSMTIVVRTPSTASAASPLNYVRSGLAYHPHHETEQIAKTRQLLCMLWGSGNPQRMRWAQAALAEFDAHSAARIVLALASFASQGETKTLIEIAARADAGFADLLQATLRNRERDHALVNLRGQTCSPRHRMLLALVLNLPDRTAIDQALRQIVPDEAPAAWLWETLRSMHDTPGRLRDRPNLLGLALNDVSEEVLQLLLRGRSVDDISRTIATEAELVEDVRALCLTLSASPLLRPLVALSPTP